MAQTRTTGRARTGRARPRRLAAAAALAVGGSLVLVAVPGAGDPPARAATLEPFGSCEAMREWFVDQALDELERQPEVMPVEGDAAGAVDEAAGPQAVASAAGGEARTGGAVGAGATGTNVQEEGVDEPDVLKTDGELVLRVDGSALHVVRVSGGSLQPLSRVDLPEGTAAEVLLVGDRAVVLGTRWEDWGAVEEQPAGGRLVDPLPRPVDPGIGGPVASTTVLTVVDLADPTDPRLLHTEEVDGGYLSAREHAGVVRVVVGSQPSLPQPLWRDGMTDADHRAARRAAITQSEAEHWLPRRLRRDPGGRVVAAEPLLSCDQALHPQDPSGTGMISVLTLDPTGERPLHATGVAADGDLVYSSADRLYVATSRWGWGFAWDMRRPDDAQETHLHAFDLTDAAAARYVASGDVPGYLLGRWAMDEHEGRLRVATTVGEMPWGGGPEGPAQQPPGTRVSESVVTVLAEQGRRLVPVGSVGGMGRGEQVRAVRWFGDLATVVTFRQTDPLYTVDLSDPTAPAVLGELKVPGYSGYLHPVGDGVLLGVGQDADETGQTLGLQVSTFDVGDLAEPRRLDVLTRPQSASEAEHESRAFVYLPERRTAVMPVGDWDGETQLLAVAVDDGGRLAEAGAWSLEGEGYVVRAVPLSAQHLVVAWERWPAPEEPVVDEAAYEPERGLTVVAVDGMSTEDELVAS